MGVEKVQVGIGGNGDGDGFPMVVVTMVVAAVGDDVGRGWGKGVRCQEGNLAYSGGRKGEEC